MTTRTDMQNPRGTDYEHWKTPVSSQPQREIPKRRKGADHFGYGHQIALGKNEGGGGLWHSHGKHYHKPDTYWCGSWGDRTPEELLFECESVIFDMRLYHPELFAPNPHTPAPSDEFTQGYKRGLVDGNVLADTWLKEHDAAIASTAMLVERERILVLMEKIVNAYVKYTRNSIIEVESFNEWIKNIRSPDSTKFYGCKTYRWVSEFKQDESLHQSTTAPQHRRTRDESIRL
jgi:hypothetical protein